MAAMSIEALSGGHFGVSHEDWERAKAEGRVRDERGDKSDVPVGCIVFLAVLRLVYGP